MVWGGMEVSSIVMAGSMIPKKGGFSQKEIEKEGEGQGKREKEEEVEQEEEEEEEALARPSPRQAEIWSLGTQSTKIFRALNYY